MSCTLSTNSGSVESLKVSLRCGCRSNAAHIRRIVVCESPTASAIERIEQWVASFGVVFSVRSMTSATWASDTVRGRPGWYSSVRPSIRSFTKRRRHLPTVCSCTPVARQPPCWAGLRHTAGSFGSIRKRTRGLVPANPTFQKHPLLGAKNHRIRNTPNHRTTSKIHIGGWCQL